VTDSGFGLKFEQVSTIVRPVVQERAWGDVTECAAQPLYGMYRVRLGPNGAQPLHFWMRGEGVYYVEEGEVVVRSRDLAGAPTAVRIPLRGVLDAPPGMVHGLCSRDGATIYMFTSEPLPEPVRVETLEEADTEAQAALSAPVEAVNGTTFDVREKYWGRIDSIVSREFVGKRIELRRAGQSSLEFHVEKAESYYVHSGRVKVGLRIGRGENKSLVLNEGDRFDIPPGLMHMRIGLEDSILMEVSTTDSDGDSYLVEDGRTYEHIAE
jgi:mannose-6-phosphate isomerase-like protein (cupin superfamily)